MVARWRAGEEDPVENKDGKAHTSPSSVLPEKAAWRNTSGVRSQRSGALQGILAAPGRFACV